MKKAIAIVSGGMDSVTLAYLMNGLGYELRILSFDYGQRHKKELEFAKLCALDLKAQFTMIDISSIRTVLGGSALTDDIEVPYGHYAAENMKVTIVPNRNAIMLAIAYGAAVSFDAQLVATAVHAGDHFIYPDCRPDFINTFRVMELQALDGVASVELYTPFINKTKADIVQIGQDFKVPYEKTWSCYEGQDLHCGKCGTCVERMEAFTIAQVKDPTQYRQ